MGEGHILLTLFQERNILWPGCLGQMDIHKLIEL